MAPEEIRQGRERLGLTQKQFANLLGVGEATVSRWETGCRFSNAPWTVSSVLCLADPGGGRTAAERFLPSARRGGAGIIGQGFDACSFPRFHTARSPWKQGEIDKQGWKLIN